MRVLGVDPGLTRCGLGVVEGLPGRQLRMVAVGVIRTPPGDDPQDRLLSVQTEIDQWLADWSPDAIAVERVFAKANIKGIMGTAQASAVPMLAAARLGLPLGLHTPSEVKASVTGNGRADKAQVTHMVTRILRLAEAPRPADAADALALAICHLWRSGDLTSATGTTSNRIQQAEDAARSGQPNRLAQLHAQHRTSVRAAAARASRPSTPARRTPP
ncbi:crossover junction endodeoxyribonuclease RuvC [Ornithinimicrobium cerasi]|uniref:Crossover junction endodeoxyribonuclease RuvC n=1 Tax=Ornithinimicrobium cerasi TaxID=2248773 RepID=A0A285VNT2_9MICO|nr:crossover junction endodeoxyribonuclease RuvC [Ornithinimicrobium cerasi]SOC54261.1 Holliday junction endonuclease RuvC [Ornithinimicrobium cerasi]